MKRFCNYCGEKSTSIKAHTAHEKECKENPSNKPQNPKIPKVPNNKQSQILSESVSDNVHVHSDIPTLLIEVMREEGYEVVFDSIPDRWSNTIRNDMYSVRFPNKEGIYAGWTGQWRGTITPIKIDDKHGKQSVSLSDLGNSWSSSKYDFSFIRTSTGCSGAQFDISGRLLVDDFPILHQKHLKDGFDSRYNDEMRSVVKELESNIRRVENEYVVKNELYAIIKAKKNELSSYIHMLEVQEQKHESQLRAKFRGDTKIELPEIECPFINMDKYTTLKERFRDKKVVIVDDDIKKAVEEVTSLINNANEFADARLECFI